MTIPPPTGDDPGSPAWAPPDAAPAQDAPAGLPIVSPGPPPLPGPAPIPGPANTKRNLVVVLAAGLCVLVLLGTGAAVAVTASGHSPFSSRDGTEPRAPKGMVATSTLAAGDCFSGYTEQYGEPVAVRKPCDGGHDGEVGAKVTLHDGPFPDSQSLLAQSTYLCKERTEFLTSRPAAPMLDLRIDLPDKDDWAAGNREVTCLLVYTGSGGLTKPLADSTATTSLSQMALGACIEQWNMNYYDYVVVECATKHEAQLFARSTLKGTKYPGDKKLDDKANTACLARTETVLEKRLPERVQMFYVRPSKETWALGDRLLFCLIKSSGEPLTRSHMRK
ncbi:hypothetical protein GCM10022254_22300 [Actinomadura meridiana]|uniref:Septum formation-related domain-containing protein n=1 Tax=Actinomadura meridiana TaxID=559626 RepID=A0ABP8BXY3_9ACTN